MMAIYLRCGEANRAIVSRVRKDVGDRKGFSPSATRKPVDHDVGIAACAFDVAIDEAHQSHQTGPPAASKSAH
jgi:hypothetical protein